MSTDEEQDFYRQWLIDFFEKFPGERFNPICNEWRHIKMSSLLVHWQIEIEMKNNPDGDLEDPNYPDFNPYGD